MESASLAYLVSRARDKRFPLCLLPVFLLLSHRGTTRGKRAFSGEREQINRARKRWQENFLTEGNEIASPGSANQLYEVASRSRLTSRAIIRDNSRVSPRGKPWHCCQSSSATTAAIAAVVHLPIPFSLFVNR